MFNRHKMSILSTFLIMIAMCAPHSKSQGHIQPVQRAALVITDQKEALGVRIYPGIVAWSRASSSPNMIKIKITESDYNMVANITMEINNNKSKPFIVVIKVTFNDIDGNTFDNIENIGILEMRKESQNIADKLSGEVINGGSGFAIGITEGDIESNNINLMKTKNWFDIPILFKSGVIGKITFEKGLYGQSIIDKFLKYLDNSTTMLK